MTSFVFYGVLLMAMMVMVVKANMSPAFPEPGTVWESGKEYEILWEEDNTEPTINATWKNFRIDLMTGEDLNQVLLTTIAEHVKGDVMKHKYTAPEVSPHAPIYFLMFTSDNGEYAWSSRFAIVGQDGKQEVPEKSTQPNGEKIPWGTGKLVSADAVSSMASASASASPSAAASKSMSFASQSSSPASPSAHASAHKGNAQPDEKKITSDAVSLSSYLGALVSSVVGFLLI